MRKHPPDEGVVMRSRLGRRSAETIVASLACAMALAVPAVAKPARVASLAGTTVVKGQAPAMTQVTLRSAARIFPHRALEASGGGRFFGFVLRPAGAPASDTRAIVGGQISFCKTAGCVPDGPFVTVKGFGFEEAFTGGQSFALPAGTYDLYLMTDGAPVQLTIRLDGLDGTTEVEPETPITMKVDSPAPSATVDSGIGAGPSLFSAGSANPVGGAGGLTFQAVTLTGMGPGDSEAGLCWYENGPPPDGNYHGCLGATWGQEIGTLHSGEVHRTLYGIALVAPRNWGLGGFVEAAIPIADPHFFSVALTYRQSVPAPAAPASSPGASDAALPPFGALAFGSGMGPAARASDRADRAARGLKLVVDTIDTAGNRGGRTLVVR